MTIKIDIVSYNASKLLKNKIASNYDKILDNPQSTIYTADLPINEQNVTVHLQDATSNRDYEEYCEQAYPDAQVIVLFVSISDDPDVFYKLSKEWSSKQDGRYAKTPTILVGLNPDNGFILPAYIKKVCESIGIEEYMSITSGTRDELMRVFTKAAQIGLGKKPVQAGPAIPANRIKSTIITFFQDAYYGKSPEETGKKDKVARKLDICKKYKQMNEEVRVSGFKHSSLNALDKLILENGGVPEFDFEVVKDAIDSIYACFKQFKSLEDKQKQMEDAFNAIHKCACCPLTGKLMVDPVITQYGNSYAKEAFENYLLSSDSKQKGVFIEPITKQKLGKEMINNNNEESYVAPNFVLQDLIEQFMHIKFGKKVEFKEETISCPIVHEELNNPVVNCFGKTYEEKGIVHWIQQCAPQNNSVPTDPLGRQPLYLVMLDENHKPQYVIPNKTLKTMLERCNKYNSIVDEYEKMLKVYEENTKKSEQDIVIPQNQDDRMARRYQSYRLSGL